jgi:hypothetical protein
MSAVATLSVVPRRPEVVDKALHLGRLDLHQLPDEINKLVSEAEHHAKSAFGSAVLAGSLLNLAKSKVLHGQWEAWVTEHCTVAPRTAQAYMRLAAKVSEMPIEMRNAVAGLPLREAIKAISTLPTAPERVRDSRVAVRWDAAQRFGRAMHKNALAIRRVARGMEGNYLKRKEVEAVRARLQAAVEQLDAYLAEATT